MRRLRFLPIALVALAACGGSDDRPAAPLATPGCDEVISGESDDRSHVELGTQIDYETDPPTSGPHYGSWADTGVWNEPIQDGFLVHNLEHGHIVVHHNGLSAEQLAAIEAVIDPTWVVVVPRASLDAKLALTAWGKLQLCDDPPDDIAALVDTFVDTYRAQAPETIPGTPRAG